jgi:hypothetical protein
LAACELLMKDKPKFAIFENVTKGELSAAHDIFCFLFQFHCRCANSNFAFLTAHVT